ncbi:MAG: hypothetical protein LBP33_00055 [Candidatus Adiutrix sp.]|jgi:hypothetical protein|nr:hypothetical protein [Candidatus Adiutrix sp.]
MTESFPATVFGRMRSALAGLRALPEARDPVEEAERSLALLADRFRHPHFPWLAAVCGPTGAGKSHLVNYLAGAPVSPSSYRRPSTAAPVILGPAGVLEALGTGDFMPKYQPLGAAGGVVFEDHSPADRLYLVPVSRPPWAWPPDLALVDTPDFDSVRLENQAQALDMARRADALILVAHQAKYADQSTWDFLAAEASDGRPLLLVLNRLSAEAAADDFRARLKASGVEAPVLTWPEETAEGRAAVAAARRELSAWLETLGREGRALTAGNGRELAAGLGRLVGERLLPLWRAREESLRAALAAVRQLTGQWLAEPRDKVSLNLPGETRASLLKSLGEVVSRSDLWAGPRRWLALPFDLLREGWDRLAGRGQGAGGPEKKLADNLNEAGREALVGAVRSQARALAELAGLPSPQAGLDFSPGEIRKLHDELSARLDQWLAEESGSLLAGLPLGQKAAFYLVQFMHLGLVLGAQIQTGGLPGTEILLGGALGPVISKLTGVFISRENLAAFEARAARRHREELAEIFRRQGRRYEDYLKHELEGLSSGRELEPAWRALEKEAERLWA